MWQDIGDTYAKRIFELQQAAMESGVQAFENVSAGVMC